VEALTNHKWISDIRTLTVGVIADYLHLRNALNGVELEARNRGLIFGGLQPMGNIVRNWLKGFSWDPLVLSLS
jgi:hypothetical protein